ncbi:MAG: hypothetical protein IK062_06180 [Selenomonadaceae bacterium]|nr:hypothetical protein [Selenomonadaceae bacterium]
MVKSLSEIMKSFGEGSRSVVQFEWKASSSNGGHVIVSAYFENGIVNFGDPQDGSRAAIAKLKDAKLDKVYIMRVDNLKFTNVVKRCCMNRGEES